jgi:hypothetical protein
MSMLNKKRVICEDYRDYSYSNFVEFAALEGLMDSVGKNNEIRINGEIVIERVISKRGKQSFITAMSTDEIVKMIIDLFNDVYDTKSTCIERDNYSYLGAAIVNDHYRSENFFALPNPCVIINKEDREVKFRVGDVVNFKSNLIRISGIFIDHRGVFYDCNLDYYIRQGDLLHNTPHRISHSSPIEFHFNINDDLILFGCNNTFVIERVFKIELNQGKVIRYNGHTIEEINANYLKAKNNIESLSKIISKLQAEIIDEEKHLDTISKKIEVASSLKNDILYKEFEKLVNDLKEEYVRHKKWISELNQKIASYLKYIEIAKKVNTLV